MRTTVRNILALSVLGGMIYAGTAAAEEATQRQRPTPEQRAQRHEEMQARWNKLDTSHDGKISREEAQKGAPKMAEHFDQMDSNGDGQLTREEMRQAHQARQAKRNERRTDRPAVKGAEPKAGS